MTKTESKTEFRQDAPRPLRRLRYGMRHWLAGGLSAGLLVSGAAFLAANAQVSAPRQGQVSGPTAGYPGIWIDDTGQGAVEILPCGGLLCGRVVWLKQPTDRSGKPVRDALNPDPRRRSQTVCGLTVIGNLKPQSNGSWDGGWIYDPKEGKTYDVELQLKSANELSVTGYLGLKFLSETFVWTRAPNDLQRCPA